MYRSLLASKSIIYLMALFFVGLLNAKISIAYPVDYTAENIQFVFANGDINKQKLLEFKDRLILRRNEVKNNLVTNEQFVKKNSTDKVSKKLNKDKTLKIFDLIFDLTDQLLNSTDLNFLQKKQLESKIIDLELSLRSDIDPVNTAAMLLKHIKTISEKISISKSKQVLGEAKNLVNPITKKVFTEKELADFIKNGGDVSLLEPISHNGVIQTDYNIENGNIQDRFYRGKNPLHQGVKVFYPQKNIFKFDEIRKKQSRPKLTVFVNDDLGQKQEYKLKLAMELHGEPTAASLSNALGIYSDLTKYVKHVKVILGTRTYDQFKLDWNSYYSEYELEKLVKEKGQDENGNYIVFWDGLLEPELDEATILRPGPWYWGAADHKFRREFRGLLLFNIWIHNTDLKEGENNKLLLRKNATGQFDFYFVQQDLGFSFGHFFRERPNDFRWDIVDSVSDKEVTFNYRNFQPNTGFEHVTWADAKWMVRKIARLSRKQIEEAVAIGNWPNQAPYNYQALLVEKLISRRNQMVQAFGLVGEKLPNGQTISLLTFNDQIESSAIKSSKSGVPGYTVDFSPEIKNQVRDVVLDKIALALKEGSISLLGSINNISVDPEWFGWDKGIVSQVIINLNRTVIKNPNPINSSDSYIVRDDFKVGARLGYGLIVSGDVAYVRSYSLVYPVATYLEGLNGRRHFIEILKKGYAQVESQLPLGHILINENYVEGRGRIEVDGGPVSLGFESSISKIDLSRSLISRKKADRILFFEDESVYTELAHKIFTRLGFFKIHHFKWQKQTGSVDRNTYELDHLNVDLVDQAIFANDFEMIKQKGQRQNLLSEFWHKTTKINLFGLWKREKDLRRDLVKIWSLSGSVENPDKLYSATKLIVEMNTEQNWKIFNNGEEHFKNVKFIGDLSEDQKITENPVLKISFVHIDKNATNNELENGYLPFIDGLASQQNFLNFTPKLHAFQGGWGELNIMSEIEIYESGLNKLVRLSSEQILNSIMNELGLLNQSLMNTFNSDGQPLELSYYGKNYLASELQTMIKKFMKEWKLVLNSQDTVSKIEALTKSMYVAGDRSGASFHPVIYRALLNQLQESDYYLSAKVFVPEDIENKLPGKYFPYNQISQKKKLSTDHEHLLFHTNEALSIYQAF